MELSKVKCLTRADVITMTEQSMYLQSQNNMHSPPAVGQQLPISYQGHVILKVLV